MKRIEWLDVMKGVAIFLVVLRHVFIGMHMMNHAVSEWIHLFYMPFFFLLSGFLAIKSLKVGLWQNYKKKFVALIVPFITCGLSMSLFLDKMYDYLYTLMHNGFWFLLSLFTCWIIFLPLVKLCDKYHLRENILVEAFILILPFFIGNQMMKFLPTKLNDILTFPLTFSMYRYFVIGYLLGKVHFERLNICNYLACNKIGGVNCCAHYL